MFNYAGIRREPDSRRVAPPLSVALVTGLAMLAAGCAIAPRQLSEDRLYFNEVVKSTAEQQLLLNIVRLRYTDTPSSLAVSNIATQTELVRSLGLFPFFGATGDVNPRGIARVLPQGQVAVTDRPTISLTPLDDTEFTRRLFTPMSLDGVLYLARTTWPIATVFRLYLENLNWVSNAQSGSGPTVKTAPDFERFARGVDALQVLQDRGHIVFAAEEREERIGGPIVATAVSGTDLIAAAKEGFEYRPEDGGAKFNLYRKRQQPVLRVNPLAHASVEMNQFVEAFRVRPGQRSYDIGIDLLDPFPENYPRDGVAVLDIETRSLLQVLFYLSKGIEIPLLHAEQGLVQRTVGGDGQPYDWPIVTRGLFKVASTRGDRPPPTAHAAVRYLDHWFYIDRRDQDSMSTFALVMELSRLELAAKPAAGPTLTLPLSGR